MSRVSILVEGVFRLGQNLVYSYLNLLQEPQHDTRNQQAQATAAAVIFVVMGGSWRLVFAVLSASVAGDQQLRVSPNPSVLPTAKLMEILAHVLHST